MEKLTVKPTNGQTAASNGRIVIVTGASGGIGTELCRRFEEHGDTVVGVDVETGLDITDNEACRRLIERVMAEYGRIDVLCNNAGVGSVGDVVSTPEADWQNVMAVNLMGTVNMCRHALPWMREQGGGTIVNTCSIAADIGLVDRVAYSASKGAVLALTRAMAADEIHHGIRVNCVSPATVDGPWVQRLLDQAPDPARARDALEARQPLGRMVRSTEVAAAILYLASDETAATGLELRLDAGLTGVLASAPDRSRAGGGTYSTQVRGG